jgi:hypothetical protein
VARWQHHQVLRPRSGPRAGLTVKWIRPRTVFSESMVTHCLQREPDSLPKLVRAELAAAADESLGAQLVISASKPRTRSH